MHFYEILLVSEMLDRSCALNASLCSSFRPKLEIGAGRADVGCERQGVPLWSDATAVAHTLPFATLGCQPRRGPRCQHRPRDLRLLVRFAAHPSSVLAGAPSIGTGPKAEFHRRRARGAARGRRVELRG